VSCRATSSRPCPCALSLFAHSTVASHPLAGGAGGTGGAGPAGEMLRSCMPLFSHLMLLFLCHTATSIRIVLDTLPPHEHRSTRALFFPLASTPSRPASFMHMHRPSSMLLRRCGSLLPVRHCRWASPCDNCVCHCGLQPTTVSANSNPSLFAHSTVASHPLAGGGGRGGGAGPAAPLAQGSAAAGTFFTGLCKRALP